MKLKIVMKNIDHIINRCRRRHNTNIENILCLGKTMSNVISNT